MIKYIVAFRPGTSDDFIDEAAKKIEENGGQIKRRFESLPGFEIEVPEGFEMEPVADYPGVQSIEPADV
ncbi:hypothetical protein BX616_009505 [Lobosporangium transversale]|uniref:Inhibitor I9 domain-containing protein n=1 Tax=Lobosporangium transversale TaxID=64571 RepID=A0A1Y2GT42_9FUNG|nr:hypothetical protein BCR41DRAFT_351361 [Lobosporangium transversale]KAF9913832.1 hypothetical protein BX616_009505 [Lobosporangium transversale]ORZ20148.1 hypothetical protein BCR41DRAFT_351361 [Lobosporangium transversale]|eukprot:XP_021882688.1 hypothetical protein BCR41DRAFT_351361 [Lobosporangium transversale]